MGVGTDVCIWLRIGLDGIDEERHIERHLVVSLMFAWTNYINCIFLNKFHERKTECNNAISWLGRNSDVAVVDKVNY